MELLSQIGTDPSKWLDFGGFAVLGGAFILVLRWMMSQFAKRLDTIVSAQIQMARSMDVNTSIIMNLQQMLLAHDLTVHGINPAAGADLNESAERAHKKYSELLSSIEETRRAVMRGEHYLQHGVEHIKAAIYD
jgi:hypothetical protein